MKNRFSQQKRNLGALRSVLLPVLVFAAIIGLFMYGLSSVNRTSQRERLRSMEQAITKTVVQCYAVEGRYPPSLAYLEESYGLVLDYEQYIIQYDVFASNMMPSILVLPMNFEAEQEAGDGGSFE